MRVRPRGEIEVGAAGESVRCVFCLDQLDGQVRECARCRARVHRECLQELSRCPTTGCGGSVLDYAAPGEKGDEEAPRGEAAEEQPSPPWEGLACVGVLLSPALILAYLVAGMKWFVPLFGDVNTMSNGRLTLALLLFIVLPVLAVGALAQARRDP